jgi:hypothetical protein
MPVLTAALLFTALGGPLPVRAVKDGTGRLLPGLDL